MSEGTRAPFDFADRGLTLGDGLFDTALALDGRVAFEAAHVARLAASAAVLGIPVDPHRVAQGMRALAGRGGRLVVRTTLTRGPGPRGLRPPDDPRPALFATAAPSDRAVAFAPLRLWPTGIARNETSPATGMKTLGYLDAVLAAREATAAGFDEALFCNTRGALACAGTGNLFCVIGAALATPPLTEGALPGVVRAEVLRLAPACGLRPEERALRPDEAATAGAVFVTNSLRLLAPVTAIGDRPLASPAHPAVERLIRALHASVARACGVDEGRVA